MFPKNFFRTLSLILVILFPFSKSHANTAFDCFYTGAAIGQSHTLSSLYFAGNGLISEIEGAGNFIFMNANTTSNFKKSSLVGALFAGYGFSCDPYYIGGELFVKIANPSYSIPNYFSTGANADTRLNLISNLNIKTRKTEFALDIRPGILLSDCSLLYARLGIARNKVTLTGTVHASFFATDLFSQRTVASSQITSKNTNAFRLGAGMEQMLSSCVSLRVDYIYTFYRKLRTGATSSITYREPLTGSLVQASFSDAIKVKTNNYVVMLGLSYYW